MLSRWDKERTRPVKGEISIAFKQICTSGEFVEKNSLKLLLCFLVIHGFEIILFCPVGIIYL
jgi:hypothetical protein